MLNVLQNGYKKVVSFIFGESAPLEYPIPYGTIEFTKDAQLLNIQDDQNKIIKVVQGNKFGFLESKNYKYTQARVYMLERRGIPIVDKTGSQKQFVVIKSQNPEEIIYTRK